MRPWLSTLVIAVLAASVLGCFNPFQPQVSTSRGLSSPAPAPNSPANVIRLIEWCYNNRDVDLYRTVFTEDYEFQFGLTDSAGNAFRDRPFRREDEINQATNLFVGGSSEPPASRISLQFDRTLIALGDSRPGKDPRWHKSIFTKVNLTVQISEGDQQSSLEVQGNARYYVVRGDSALIPAELVQAGFRADSTRWWVERWEDETLPSGGIVFEEARVRHANGGSQRLAGMPEQPMTWGEVKRRFLPRLIATARRTLPAGEGAGQP